MKKRILSFLMVLVLLVGMLPVGTIAAETTCTSGTNEGATAEYTEKVADASTQDVWSNLMNTYQSTQYVGRIWTDKTVFAGNATLTHKLNSESGTTTTESTTLTMNANADFQVVLSAMSSTASYTTVTQTNTPLDIVLVLDMSSSMTQTLGTTTRIAALKTAVADFLAEVATVNATLASEYQHQVGIVTYHSSASTVQELTKGINANIVNSLNTSQGTHTDYGMTQAVSVLSGTNARTNATPVVILFTDGYPTTSGASAFNATYAAEVVKTSYNLKNNATTNTVRSDSDVLVYSVAVIDDSNTSVTPPATSVTDKNINYFLHAASSNYPDATATYSTYTNQSSNSSWTLTAGTQASTDYYLKAESAAELDEIFKDIAQSVTSIAGAASPTYTASGMDSSATGYVTMVDELGDYMEIKSMDAITLEGQVYNYSGTTTASGDKGGYTETTYVFSQSVTPATTLDARQGSAKTHSLGDILITERDYTDPIYRDTLTVSIPVGLLPLRYYSVDENGTLTIKETLPIRVVYSVGLLDAVRTALSTGDYDSVNGLTAYAAAHTNTNGEISFYSNYWDGTDSNGDNYSDGNTHSTFVPATTNPFYYYTEDTVFYKLVDSAYVPVKQSSGYQADLSGTVYYQHTYYDSTGLKTAYVGLDIDAAINRIGSISWDNIASYIGINANGEYYMIAGNAKLSLANATNFIETKDDGNHTATATTVLNPSWSADAIGGNYDIYATMNYMGNNGRISFIGLGSLIVVKNVTSEANQSPSADTVFTFTITLSDTTTESVTYPAIHTGADGIKTTTVTFTNGVATVTLKANESIIINELPHGTTYTVAETGAKLGDKDVSNAYTTTYTDGDTSYPAEGATTTDGKGTIATNETDTVSVNNTYKYTNTPVNTTFDLSGDKTLSVDTGSTYSGSEQTATFYLQYWHGNTEIGGGWSNVTNSDGSAVTGTATYSSAGDVTISYDNINSALKTWNFTEPGTYLFRIVENNGGLTLHGVYHDETTHSFVVTVADNGDGTLSISNVASAHRDGSTSNWTYNEATATWSNSAISFTNRYGTTQLTINIDKDIRDTTSSGYNDMDGFSFNWQYLGSYTEAKTSYDGLSYSGNGASGTTTTTTTDGTASFSIVYDVSDDATTPTVNEDGIHVYPSGSSANSDVAVAADEPDVTEPGATEPETSEPKTSEPETSEPEASEPETSEPETSEPETSEPETSVPETSEPETSEPGSTEVEPSAQSVEDTVTNDVEETGAAENAVNDKRDAETETNVSELSAGTSSYSIVLLSNVTSEEDETPTEGETPTEETPTEGTHTEEVPTEETPSSDGIALASEDGEPVAQAANGTYYEYYKITEDTTSKTGVTNSKASYIVQVVVLVENETITTSYSVVQYSNGTTTYTYNSSYTGSGYQWVASDGSTITRSENDAVIFTNTYSDSTTATLGVAKTLTGRDWKDGDSFVFTLTPIQYEGMGLAFNLSGNTAVVQTTMPESPNALTATATSSSLVNFSAITFTQVGTYYFKVTENAGTAGGVTYSTDTIYAKVEVTADSAHNLSAAVYTYKDGQITEANGVYNLGSFTNAYTAQPVSVTFSGNKTLTGRTLAAGEFAFGLYYGEELIASATNDANGYYSFPARTYTAPGTYVYTVKEINGGLPGVSYATNSYTVTVTVTDDGNGKLVASVENGTGLNFSNTYAASGTVYLTVTKTISGRSWVSGDSFTFGLYKNDPSTSDEAPVQIIIAATDSVEQGTTTLSNHFAVDLSAAGTYTYYIKEMTTSTDTMMADSTVYKVDITATDNGDGTLATSYTISKVGSETEAANAIAFTNTYTAKDTQVALQVNKNLTGRDWLDSDSFTFTLTAVTENAPMPTSSTVQVTKATGSTMNFGAITYTAAGTYEYTITEQKGTAGGITYDETSCNVKVLVVDNNGQLTATVTYGDDSGAVNASFTNTYTAGSTSITFSGTKTLNGADLTAGAFSFVLKDSKGSDIQTVQNGEGGSFSFAAIEYTAAGTYTYTVSEVKGNTDGIIYDETVYTVTVTVTDHGDGTLSASAAYEVSGVAKNDIAFENTYLTDVHNPASFKVKKVDTDGTTVLPGAVFTLYSDAACTQVVKAQTADENGKATFSGFNSTATYYLKETTAPDGYQEVDTVWKVTVKLKDGDPTIKIFKDENIFQNIWNWVIGEVDPGTWDGTALTLTVKNAQKLGKLTISKSVVDSENRNTDAEYSFTLDASVDSFDQTFTLKAGESKTIDNIPWGTTYTLAEDTTGAAFTSAITDSGEGKIWADETTITVTNTYKYKENNSGLNLLKVVKGTTTPIEGAAFALYSDEDCKTLVSGGTTGTDGKLNLNLPYADATYYLKETQPAPGYHPNDTVYTVVTQVNYEVKNAGTADAYTEKQLVVSITGLTANTIGYYTVENTPIKLVEISVEKKWDDSSYYARPAEVTAVLYRDGEKYDTVKLNADNGWKHTWSGEKYTDEYTWTVDESTVPDGYIESVTNSGNAWTITNSRTAKEIEITVTKDWVNNGGTQPDSIAVTLFKNGEVYETVRLSESNNWTKTWTGLTDASQWSLKETSVPAGYNSSIIVDGYSFKITNTRIIHPVKVTVNKVWEASDGVVHPESVEAVLYRNGEIYDTVALKESNNWSYTWDDLTDKYTWTVDEPAVPDGYTKETSYVADTTGETHAYTYTITNAKIFKYIDVSVKKVWYGSDVIHPTSVKVTLYRDGDAYAQVTLKASNNWSYTWENLTDEFTWTVDEPSVPSGYNKKVSHSSNSWTITNTYEDIPATGDGFDSLGLVLMATVGVVGFCTVAFLMLVPRKKGKYQR